MSQTYNGRELGFQLQRKRSKRNPAITITDLDFVNDLRQKNSLRSAFLLIRHSNYSAILIHSYRLLFGDFAHWVAFCQIQQALKRSRLGDEAQKIAVILKRLEKGTAKSSTMTSVARKVTT